MTIKRIQPWRRIAEAIQALVILGTPFVRINGESALRFDIASLRLHVFGVSLWMDEFFIVLMGLFFLTFLIILITLLFGRIWCGWFCPQTVIIDITSFLDRASTKGITQKIAAYFLTLLCCIVVAASLIWYFVSPYDFLPALLAGHLGLITWGFWLSLSVILFLDYAFLRHTWCKTVCPYAKLQGALFDNNTMVIAFDQRREDDCMDCRACVKVCPVGIDIRKGINAACINCAECLDTCSGKMEKKQKPGLIGYFFGRPGNERNLLRPNALLIGVITLLFFLFFVYHSYTRNPYDLTVMPNYDMKPRITDTGELLNSFVLAAENKSRGVMEFRTAATTEGQTVKVIPEKIALKAGEYRRITVYLFIPGKVSGSVELIFEASQPSPAKIVKILSITAPSEGK
ncbi:MAG: 4Fe-4S binding protein [Nitrospirae bacterium]|nr:4Fe-4S binding protein [Nitrospirota bacterium]